jgi:hypothetical protein
MKTKTAISESENKILLPGIRNSNESYLKYFRALVSGPSCSGKTFVAATMSKYCPEKFDRVQKEQVDLPDVLWFSVDAGALIGLGQFNYNVREISLREGLMSPPKKGETKTYEKDLIKALAKALSLIQKMVCDYGVETVVIDTASQLNSEICSYWADPNRRPSIDMKYWSRVRDTEAAFFPKLLYLPCNLIVLSHEKPVLHIPTRDGNDSAKKRLEAHTPDGNVEFALAICGGALGDYYANMDIAVTLMLKDPGRGKPFIRTLHPRLDGRAGKCRLQQLLKSEEKPHLKLLCDRLRQRQRGD